MWYDNCWDCYRPSPPDEDRLFPDRHVAEPQLAAPDFVDSQRLQRRLTTRRQQNRDETRYGAADAGLDRLDVGTRSLLAGCDAAQPNAPLRFEFRPQVEREWLRNSETLH